MTTLKRVQEAAKVAAGYVGGPTHAAFVVFIGALEKEIKEEKEEDEPINRTTT